VTRAVVVSVPIAQVVIGARRRDKLGKVKALAHSIEAHGLIHPILLRGEMLIAGHRRLEACRLLGWKMITARQVDRMTDDELRAIELDENTARENLSDYATSKARLAQIRQAEADLKSKAAERVSVSTRNGNSKRGRRGEGRPKGTTEPGSKRDVAVATGISPTEQVRVERHVALAEAYPFMQRQGWQRHHVLDAGDLLDQLPEEDCSPIAVLLDQDGIPPPDALRLLMNGVAMTAARRRNVIELAASEDPFVRRTALTKLGDVPPPVDPGLMALHDADRAMERAAATCRSAAFKPRLTALATDVGAVLREFRAKEKEARASYDTAV
jgi:ParB family chromosome partitioning protein